MIGRAVNAQLIKSSDLPWWHSRINLVPKLDAIT